MEKRDSEDVCNFSNEEDASLKDESIKAKLLSQILLAESEIEEGKFTDVGESITHIFHQMLRLFLIGLSGSYPECVPNVFNQDTDYESLE